MDRRESGRECVDGTPVFGREEGETDFAGREGDVRVGDSGCEGDGGWCEGVVGWDFDLEVPESACHRGVSWVSLRAWVSSWIG